MARKIILIIDDDALLRWSLATNLEDEGFEPRAFASGPDALKYITDGGAASGILLDWEMPEMDGITVLNHLRHQGCLLPVIFLTGHCQPGRRAVAMACGAAAFLDKAKSFSTVLHYLHLALSEGEDEAGDDVIDAPLAPVRASTEPYALK